MMNMEIHEIIEKTNKLNEEIKNAPGKHDQAEHGNWAGGRAGDAADRAAMEAFNNPARQGELAAARDNEDYVQTYHDEIQDATVDLSDEGAGAIILSRMTDGLQSVTKDMDAMGAREFGRNLGQECRSAITENGEEDRVVAGVMPAIGEQLAHALDTASREQAYQSGNTRTHFTIGNEAGNGFREGWGSD